MIEPVEGARFQARAARLALDAGEPSRVVRALCQEAGISSGRGPQGAARAERLLALAQQVATGTEDRGARAMITVMSGIGAGLRGEFLKARGDLEAGEQLLSCCTGVAFDLDAVRVFKLDSLFYLGELAELTAQVSEGMRENEERGARFPATNLRTSLKNAVWLVSDTPERARQEARLAIEGWSRQRFFIQHWFDLLAQTQIDLYEAPQLALARVMEAWPALTRSRYLSFHHPRTAALHLRARAAIAHATTCAGQQRARDLALARRDQRALIRAGGWATGLGALVGASIAAASGDVTGACAQLDGALNLLDAADMRLYATAARLLACHLPAASAEARATMVGAGVATPEKFAALLVPGWAAVPVVLRR